MRELSASKLALVEHCQYPWTSGKRWPPYEQSAAGVFGERVHLACEALVTGAPVWPTVLAELTEAEARRLEGCVESASRYLNTLREPMNATMRTEIDLRYHVASGAARVAGPDEQRTKRPGEWTVRIDLVLAGGGLVHVIDWKTGQQKNTADAGENWQMRLAAVAAARWAGVHNARVVLVYLDEHGYDVDDVPLGPFDLAVAAAELRELRKRVTAGPTPPVPGPWCTQQYCPLVGECPATQAALASVYPLEQPLTVTIRDDEHARFVLERLDGAQKALEAVRGAVREYARHRPVPMGDGKVYGWRKTSRREVKVDTSEQLEALRSVLGPATSQAVTVETTTSIDAIKVAAQELAGGPGARGQKAIVDRALEALEAAGGVRVSEFEKPEVFKPKEDDT